MLEPKKLKSIIFDYGATIDTNGIHWSEVIRKAYESLHIQVEKDDFRNAYIHGERTLATHKLVLPQHNFWHVLNYKAQAQISMLQENSLSGKQLPTDCASKIADWCYAYAQTSVNRARPILKELAESYPLILVTNFYGNISTVLDDFYLREFFPIVIESAVVGVRKPNPEIFRLAVAESGFLPEEVAVIGDSFGKDIAPAASLGCPTIWLRNTGWDASDEEGRADVIVSSFEELRGVFQIG